jgi:hypothetical protein
MFWVGWLSIGVTGAILFVVIFDDVAFAVAWAIGDLIVGVRVFMRRSDP